MKPASTCCIMSSSSGIPPVSSNADANNPAAFDGSVQQLQQQLYDLFEAQLQRRPGGLTAVVGRLAREIDRICRKSDRIQASGRVAEWQQNLMHHRVGKCLDYYRLGSEQGRVELQSTLSAIVYRHVAPPGSHLGFQGRYALLEDLMQTFYIEAMNAFRREHDLADTYTPRTRLELAEYMAFCEQYAKRRITIRGHQSQQLIVLRAQTFSRRLPAETAVDMALVSEGAKTEEAESQIRSSVVYEVREKMSEDSYDPADAVMRDRIITSLVDYLKAQNQHDCVDYLALKLQDCSAAEIDDILGITPRERDYLQQRFKYHVEKFAQQQEWELVHQWLEANLEQRLGLTPEEWTQFIETLSPEQQRFVGLKQAQQTDGSITNEAIAKTLGWTPKKVNRSWSTILKLAWNHRNQSYS
jgi:hypothetical protein